MYRAIQGWWSAVLASLLLAGCPNLQGIPALASPHPIVFENVPPSAPPQTRTLQIQNIGGGNLTVMSVEIYELENHYASDPGFSVVTIEGTLASGQSISTIVTYSAKAASPNFQPAGRILITTDSPSLPKLYVQLNATKDLRPPLPGLTLDFKAVPVGTQKALALQITGAREAAPPSVTGLVDGGGFLLGPTSADGGLFEQQFVFAPTSAQHYGPMSIAYVPCAGCAQQNLTLQGQGIEALVFESDGGILSTLDMGTVVVGIDAGARVKLVNQWNDQVVFDGLSDASPFSTSTTPGMMQPGEQLDVAIGFQPVDAGNASAELTASYHVGAQALTSEPLVLTGRGISDRCDLSWSPPDVFFGYVPAGFPQPTHQKVTLINRGALPCTVANFAIFPPAEALQFFVPDAGSFNVPRFPGTQSFDVGFKPAPTVSPIHQRGATLTFDTGDPVNPDGGISLSGSLQLEAYGGSAWPKWHHDNGNTGLSPVDTTGTLGVLTWKAQLEGNPGINTTFLQGPALDQTGAVYQLSGSNGFFKLIDGGTVATTPLPAPVLFGGSFLVAGIESTPTIIAGQPWIAIATNQTPDAGRILANWGTTIANLGSSGPVAGFVGLDGGPDGGLYVADDLTSRVVRLSESGSVLTSWDLCGGGPACALETFSGALADDGTSYWTGGSSWAFALAPDGTSPWSVSLSGGFNGLVVHTAPALLISSGVVYGVGAYQRNGGSIRGGTVYALNQSDGGVLWTVPLPEYDSATDNYPIGYSSPALRGDGILVVGYRDGVYLISPQGQLISVVSDATRSGVVGSAAIGADGTVYVGTLGGVLLAIDVIGCGDAGFCPRWSYAPEGGTTATIGSSPAIGADGTIYFMAGGYVFAVH